MRRAAGVVAIAALLAPLRALAGEPDEIRPRPIPPAEETPTHESESAQDSVLGGATAQGGYAAPALQMTTLALTPAVFAGVEGGWVIDHRFVLAAAVYGLVTDVAAPSALQPVDGTRAHVEFFYGGLRPALVLAPSRIVHMSTGVLVGGGSVGSETTRGPDHAPAAFFAVEPDIALEANVASAVRASLGFGYRFCGGTGVSGFGPAALSGPAATFAIRFGAF